METAKHSKVIIRFLTPDGPGFTKKGKGRQMFVNKLLAAFNDRGFDAAQVSLDHIIGMGPIHGQEGHIFLVLNELVYARRGNQQFLQNIEINLQNLGYIVHGGHDILEQIAVKSKQNAALTKGGVPMPEIVQSGKRPEFVFSNRQTGANVTTQVIDKEDNLDLKRYNTTFIDTVHEYKNEKYYVCFRTNCVGYQVVNSVVRVSNVEGGSPNVRNRTTPLDPDILNYFHQTLVLPSADQAAAIARGVTDVFGANFYSLDILPEAGTGKLILCEANLKLIDGHYSAYFKTIGKQLECEGVFDGTLFNRYSQALDRELTRLRE